MADIQSVHPQKSSGRRTFLMTHDEARYQRYMTVRNTVEFQLDVGFTRTARYSRQERRIIPIELHDRPAIAPRRIRGNKSISGELAAGVPGKLHQRRVVAGRLRYGGVD